MGMVNIHLTHPLALAGKWSAHLSHVGVASRLREAVGSRLREEVLSRVSEVSTATSAPVSESQ